MESREVVLLTRGYLTGRLTFEYPTALSRLREQVILNELERECLLDSYKLKTLVSAHTINVNPREGVKRTNKLLESFMELALPYLFEEGTIKSNNPHLGKVTTEKLKGWAAILNTHNSTTPETET